MPRWLDYLKRDTEMLEDWAAHLAAKRERVQRDQDKALSDGNLAGAQKALGAKEILDILRGELTLSEREEASYARFTGSARNSSRR